MKNIKKVLSIIFVLFSFTGIVYAEEVITDPPVLVPGCMDNTATNYNPSATTDDESCIYPEPTPIVPDPVSIHLTITANNNLYDQDLIVNACDSDNPASGNLKVTAYCAILQSGLSTDWNFAWAPGIFLNSINDISGFTTQDVAGADVYHYWNWASNGTDAIVGLNQYNLQPGDTISLNFIDPQPIQREHHSSGGSIKIEKKLFDLQKALEFLSSQQKKDGSFGAELYTDWTSLAFASSPDFQDIKTKLINYYSTNKFTDTNLTDYERYAMTLMALNLNPYNTNKENYIEKIVTNFDGTQFGDKEQINDDIFALIVLQNAGYSTKDEVVQKTIDFIISKQKEDGSWNENVDITGAGMQSLASFQEDEKVKNTLEKALSFLEYKKRNDNWENISSTAWAIGGENALKKEIPDSIKEYFGENQEEFGNIKNDDLNNKIWQTSYVITSLSNKTWNEIMQKFEKQASSITLQPKEIKINQTIPIIENKIKNSNQNKFVQKLEKFQKPILKTKEVVQNQNIEKPIVPIKKQNWFQELISKIFRF